MKKTFITIAATVLLMSGTTAYAATNTASVDQLIAQLQAQIATLMTQLSALKAAQTTVSTSQTSINETLALIGNLKEGMSGEQVLLLQTALASDPDIYPEGQISGYYGKLTTQAIKRFQKKHNLPETGFTGSLTIKEINKILKTHQISRDDRDDDDRDDNKKIGRFCIPPGHAVASGWLKKTRESNGRGNGNGNIKWTNDGLLIPFCNNKNGSTTPNTSDTTAPVISSLAVSGITINSGTLTWTTNEKTSSKIFVSTVSPVATATAAWANGSYTLSHSATISGLSANTLYYFVVRDTDTSGNKTETTGSFTTSAVSDTAAPVISAINVSNITSSSVSLNWATNEGASGKVFFGITSPVNTSLTANWSEGAFTTSRSASLSGLSANTLYYYVIQATDASGNVSTSSQGSFTTSAAPDTTAPVISSVLGTPTSSTTATVSWTTNETASSKVYFGTVTPLVIGTATSIFDGTFGTAHSMSLAGLASSTTYYAVVESRDTVNNVATSSQFSFVTPAI